MTDIPNPDQPVDANVVINALLDQIAATARAHALEAALRTAQAPK